MRKYLLILAIFLFSCVSTKEIFTTVEHSEQDSYGYTVDNPILIGHYNHWQKNTDLSYFFLSRLKKNGIPLQMLMHATVIKPKDQPRKREPIPLRYGTPSSLGGKYLDLFVMVPRGTTDTLKLYFDVEIKGQTKVPKGLEFDYDQINNIYR